jgi:hypothetical protein
MACLHHTDDDGPPEYYVTPFDPPSKVKCQCPGDCPGDSQLSYIYNSQGSETNEET